MTHSNYIITCNTTIERPVVNVLSHRGGNGQRHLYHKLEALESSRVSTNDLSLSIRETREHRIPA